MEMMDEVAFMTATRFARKSFVTVSCDRIDFKKPISCHLYPIRITKYDHYHAINYDRWSICSPACSLGESLGVPVYQFLKEPLIRAYGEEWYHQLCQEIESKKSV